MTGITELPEFRTLMNDYQNAAMLGSRVGINDIIVSEDPMIPDRFAPNYVEMGEGYPSFERIMKLKELVSTIPLNELFCCEETIAWHLAYLTRKLGDKARFMWDKILQYWMQSGADDHTSTGSRHKNAARTRWAQRRIYKLAETFHAKFSEPYEHNRFMRNFVGNENEEMFDSLLDAFFTNTYKVVDKQDCVRKFKHFMVCRKRDMLHLPVHFDAMLLMYSSSGDGGLMWTLANSFCMALSGFHDHMSFIRSCCLNDIRDLFSSRKPNIYWHRARTVVCKNYCVIKEDQIAKLRKWVRADLVPIHGGSWKHKHLGLVATLGSYGKNDKALINSLSDEGSILEIDAVGNTLIPQASHYDEWIDIFSKLFEYCPIEYSYRVNIKSN